MDRRYGIERFLGFRYKTLRHGGSTIVGKLEKENDEEDRLYGSYAQIPSTIHEYIESLHSRESRSTMTENNALLFDGKMEEILSAHARGNRLEFEVVTKIVWGRLV